MNRKLLILGSIFGGTAVLLGAFGAHGLKQLVNADAVASFETGVRYQMYHALLLLLLGGILECSEKRKKTLYYLLLIGILMFSGSIYLLATQEATKIDFSAIALLTPLGGALLMVSWGILLYTFVKR
ncbi:DUF423 domain-containing protein [Flavimarina sp. Hel_I_48]|uniref:DUF423 domain-containing protein n=1 Tax=Flavimarina sp. Hel_I_48 TaxID=1392488 RepID=UPI0004DF2980|nr:DUF423 domain-containing protein [Flavimarina sp. Hel_I_48]